MSRQAVVVLAGLLLLGLYGILTVSFASEFARRWGTSTELVVVPAAVGFGFGVAGCVAGGLLVLRHQGARLAAGVAAGMTWAAAVLPLVAAIQYGDLTSFRVALAVAVVAAAATWAWFVMGRTAEA